MNQLSSSGRVKSIVLFMVLMSMGVMVLHGQLHCINYTIQDGLPSENVICAAEDKNGFMWFGTGAGVCQFDGINFLNYSSIGEGESPGGVFVTAIEIDHQDNLWIGTENQGIYYLDRMTKLWTHFTTDQTGFLGLRSNEIFCLHGSDQGLMYYGGSNSGLGSIDMKNKVHVNFDMHELPSRNTWQNRIYNMIDAPGDSDKYYVVGQGYVYEFDQKTQKFNSLNISEEPTIQSGYVFSPHTIAAKSNREIWLGTWNSGIKSYDPVQGTFEDQYPVKNPLSINWRSNIYDGSENEFWIADRQHGIGRYDLKTNRMDFFTSEPYNRNGLLKGEYNAIYHSSQNQTWALTSQGISLIVPRYQAFSYFDTDVPGTNFFLDIDLVPGSSNFVASYAGENGPIKLLNPDFSVISSANFREPKEAFQAIFQTVEYQDKLICRSDRLYEYNTDRNRLIPYEIPGYVFKSGMNDLIVDDLMLWLLIGNGSLVSFNALTQEVNEYHFDGYHETNPEHILYYGMTRVGHEIWIATKAEIVQFDLRTKQFRYFHIRGGQLNERQSGDTIIYAATPIDYLVPSREHAIWVSTSGSGLYLVSENGNGEYHITDHRDKSHLDQLQSVVEMIQGTNDDYWLATLNGLVHADSMLQTFQVFGQNEGLRNSKLSQGLTRLGDDLFIGMPKGFAQIDTRILIHEKKQAQVIISQVEVGDFEFNRDTVGRMKHWNNNIVIHVASSNYDEPKSVTYASRLLNHIDEWQFSDAYERVFRYENLRPGKYVFEVKAKSPGSEWSEVETYAFRIKPPFWKTNWFRGLMLAGLLALGYLMYQLKLRRDLMEERVKTRLASLESQALRAQMNPHFIFNSLNSIKSLILLDRKQEGVKYLTKFSRMVREILTLSKERSVPLEKELELLRIYLDMESLRFHQKFEYQIHIDPSTNLFAQQVPPLLIQPYVENSIWHGLLHKEGDALLHISVKQEEGFLWIMIEDNGIGREASALAKSKNSIYKKTSEGLQLSKNRVDLVSDFADVQIEDLKDERGAALGTRVTIKLPENYGNEISSNSD